MGQGLKRAAAMVALAASVHPAAAQDAPRAFIDGSSPGWRPLGESDFTGVNGAADTWAWKDGVLRSTDMMAQQDPSLLQDALFMHSLTTGSSAEGDVYVEVAYRFYAKDHSIHPDAARLGEGAANLGKPAADQTAFACTCDPLDNDSTRCHGLLEFGNYEFSLSVAYNHEQCADSVNPKRREEFQRSMQTADRLIDLYLKPLRRKPRWL